MNKLKVTPNDDENDNESAIEIESLKKQIAELQRNDIQRGHVLIVVAVAGAILGALLLGVLWMAQVYR